MPGPVPLPDAAQSRPRERRGAVAQPTVKGVRRGAPQPAADPDWHPIAAHFWLALAESGQADFYEASDWAFALALCDDLSAYKSAVWKDGTVKRSPEMLKALLTGMERLLVTEGDRRRVRMELVAPPDESTPAAVLAIADYRADLGEVDGTEEDDDPVDE